MSNAPPFSVACASDDTSSTNSTHRVVAAPSRRCSSGARAAVDGGARAGGAARRPTGRARMGVFGGWGRAARERKGTAATRSEKRVWGEKLRLLIAGDPPTNLYHHVQIAKGAIVFLNQNAGAPPDSGEKEMKRKQK